MEFEVHLGVDQDGSGTGFYKREIFFVHFSKDLESHWCHDCSHFPVDEWSANMLVVSAEREF